jgi:hypothetical protein
MTTSTPPSGSRDSALLTLRPPGRFEQLHRRQGRVVSVLLARESASPVRPTPPLSRTAGGPVARLGCFGWRVQVDSHRALGSLMRGVDRGQGESERAGFLERSPKPFGNRQVDALGLCPPGDQDGNRRELRFTAVAAARRDSQPHVHGAHTRPRQSATDRDAVGHARIAQRRPGCREDRAGDDRAERDRRWRAGGGKFGAPGERMSSADSLVSVTGGKADLELLRSSTAQRSHPEEARRSRIA